jgi:hypothetical protein
MHDTPPPTKFSDGSFNAQVRDALVITPAGGGRFHHRFVPTDPGAAPPFIAHLKVVRGNGDVLYFDPTAENSVIKIWLEKDAGGGPQGDLVITGGADVLIDCDSRLKDPIPGAKHRQRYDHAGSGVGFHISRIKSRNLLVR